MKHRPELAVHISNPAALKRERAFLNSHRPADLKGPILPLDIETDAWNVLLENLAGGPEPGADRVQRLYLGNEFCRHLYWSREELLFAAESAKDNGFAVTVVLGPVLQRSLDDTTGTLAELVRELGTMEVVANDWGMLSLLRDAGVIPVAGRFLFRMKRLPRLSTDTRPVMGDCAPADTDERALMSAQLDQFARFQWDSPWMLEFAHKLGVARVDTEMIPQGLTFSGGGDVHLSLHLPFTYITGGGRCPVSELSREEGETICAKGCRRTQVRPGFPTKTWQLVQLGHTLFSPMSSLFPHYLVLPRFDRYIMEPGFPI